MDLREFVKETLVQVSLGVQDAIKEQTAAGAVGAINPVWGPDAGSISKEHIQLVEFDVAVTATEKVGGTGKAGLKVLTFSVGGEGEKSTENSTVSRVNSPFRLFLQLRL